MAIPPLFRHALLGCSLLGFSNIVAADTSKAVIGFPVLGQGALSADLYLYACADATCTSITQLTDYGHITNVHRWPKSLGGPGGPAPQTWVFLTLTGVDQYFQFWQQMGDQWQNCIFEVTANGAIGPGTTCVGAVSVTPPGGVTDNLPYFNMGAAMFPPAGTQANPPNPAPQQTNSLPARTLTYMNQTANFKLCLQTDSSFNHSKCSNGGIQLARGVPFVIRSEDLADGVNSGLGQVAALKAKRTSSWKNTGKAPGTNGQVYATNLEYTLWPVTANFTGGPTTIDISLVNGFNVGAKLSADSDTACYIADSEGGTPYFMLYKANAVMAQFPSTAGSLANSCPADEQVARGCYSPCSNATATQATDADQYCCSSPYNTPASCTLPPTTDYVKSVDINSTRVYSWAYEDYRGTFTCEPSASFTFTLIDAYSL